MRVNVYAEEMTDRIEIIEKDVDGNKFTALRFYLELPASYHINSFSEVKAGPSKYNPHDHPTRQLQAPFVHKPGDDDSAAVTFWGKRDLRKMLRIALEKLDAHYEARGYPVEE